MTWQSLLAGCWFGHSLIRERRGKSYVLVCQDCGYTTTILKGLKFKARKPAKVVRFSQRKRVS